MDRCTLFPIRECDQSIPEFHCATISVCVWVFVEWNLRGETKTGIANFSNFTKPKKQKSPLQIYCSERATHRAATTNACQVEVDIDLLAAQPVVTVKWTLEWMGGKVLCVSSHQKKRSCREWAGKLIGIATTHQMSICWSRETWKTRRVGDQMDI